MGAKNKRRFKVNKAERIHYTYDDDTTIRLLSFGKHDYKCLNASVEVPSSPGVNNRLH